MTSPTCRVIAHAGEYVYVPADMPHLVINRSGAPCRALVAHTAAGVGSAALLVPSIISLLMAVVLFLASKLLGRVIAVGLGDSDRPAEPGR